MAELVVKVFGKPGCDKCKVLNRRLDELLAQDEWKSFEKVYCDVETEDGLIEFSNAECINPQRIPAMLVTRVDGDGRQIPLDNPRKGELDTVCKGSRLYTYLGLQTDYDAGGGVITPKMLKSILAEARQADA